MAPDGDAGNCLSNLPTEIPMTHRPKDRPVNNNSGKRQSCVLCNQRKVKCDRKDPCNHCTKARTQCIFRPHAVPRRGKARPKESDLLARLRRCEALLDKHGIDPDKVPREGEHDANRPGLDSPDQTTCDASLENKQIQFHPLGGIHGNKHVGRLITKGGRSMYIENHLWTNLSEKMRDPGEILESASDEENEEEANTEEIDPEFSAHELLMGPNPVTDAKAFYPTFQEGSYLWEVFKENVNPLSHCVHIPTEQPLFLQSLQNPGDTTKQHDALFLAIIASAVNSLSDEECKKNLGEGRKRVLRRYQVAAQRALTATNFLKSSDITVLKGFFHFLVSIRSELDPRILWLMTGMAVRIGQRIGIHRDGASLGLSPFATEMRLRLCWQIYTIDSHSGQLAGSGNPININYPELPLPLNVNDDELYPDMTSPPPERKGPTEMMFNMVRFSFGRFFKFMGGSYGGSKPIKPAADLAAADPAFRDQKINELEEEIEAKYLRYCDPLIPLHAMTMIMARGGMAGMRLMSHHPVHRPDKGAGMSQAEKEHLFNLSVRIIGYYNQAMRNTQLHRYLWHIGTFLQFGCMIYLVGELRQRATGPEVDEAWNALAELFEHRPEIFQQRRTLPLALLSLAMKAWQVREAELIRLHGHAEAPPFIAAAILQRVSRNKQKSQQADTKKPPQPHKESGAQLPTPESTVSTDTSTWNPADMYGFNGYNDFNSDIPGVNDTSAPMDWAAWDELMKDFDEPDPRLFGN